MSAYLSHVLLLLFSCNQLSRFESISSVQKNQPAGKAIIRNKIVDSASWAYFLQNLPEEKGEIIDYKGKPVPDQWKHVSIIPYDVGKADLQQCADALMRLRAEYLFQQGKSEKIGFHFTSGHYYSFKMYCEGVKPVSAGNSVRFVRRHSSPADSKSLRKYLDIVFAYAGTISLAKELKPSEDFAVGTVVISPGSPGHCFIITSEASSPSGERLFKLVEGYTPAQSIYVLKNVAEPILGQWHKLSKEKITTASYSFQNFLLRKFE